MSKLYAVYNTDKSPKVIAVSASLKDAKAIYRSQPVGSFMERFQYLTRKQLEVLTFVQAFDFERILETQNDVR